MGRLSRMDPVGDDVAAYRRRPPTGDETELAEFAEAPSLDDDTDWEALYAGSDR